MIEIPQGDDLRALIDAAKAAQQDKLKDEVDALIPKVPDNKLAEAPNPSIAVYIGTQLSLVKAQKDEILKVEKEFTAALKNLIGAKDGLRAGDVTIATVSRFTAHKLNNDLVKEMFPYDEYPQLYVDSEEQERLNLNKDFKAEALRQQKEIQG